MATFSINDLTTPLTKAQIQESIYRVLAIVGVNTTTWKPGAVVRTMIAGVSIVFASFSQLMASIAKSGWLETAEGDWLTLVARYVYNVERPSATYATTTILLSNSGGGIYALDAGDLIVSNPTTGATYRNTAAFTLNALQVNLSVPVIATVAGSTSTSNPNTITKLETTLLNVTCTNPTAAVGTDAASDPELRALCYEKLGTLSPNGPWDAYSYVAKTTKRADGTPIGVTRVRSTKDGYGNVYVYCATATGGIAGDEFDETTDLGAIAAALRLMTEPLSITVRVFSAVPVVVPLSYAITLYNTSGLSVSQIQDKISARLLSFFQTQPVGGNVIGLASGAIYQDALRTVIGSTLPQIFHVVITSPSTDIVLTAESVAVLGTVTPTIVQLAPPEGLLI